MSLSSNSLAKGPICFVRTVFRRPEKAISICFSQLRRLEGSPSIKFDGRFDGVLDKN